MQHQAYQRVSTQVAYYRITGIADESLCHSYPHLHQFFVSMYNKPEFKKWTNFYHIKAGYAGASRRANDKEVIVPAGPSVEDVL